MVDWEAALAIAPAMTSLAGLDGGGGGGGGGASGTATALEMPSEIEAALATFNPLGPFPDLCILNAQIILGSTQTSVNIL